MNVKLIPIYYVVLCVNLDMSKYNFICRLTKSRPTNAQINENITGIQY